MNLDFMLLMEPQIFSSWLQEYAYFFVIYTNLAFELSNKGAL